MYPKKYQSRVLNNIFCFIKLFSFIILILLPGCSSIISSAITDLMKNLSNAIIDNDEPKTVEAGAPAYLLLIDGFLLNTPDNINLLINASKLYTAYSGIFVTDIKRSKKMSEKALNYALRAACLSNSKTCSLRMCNFKEFNIIVKSMNIKDVSILYTLGSSWSAWIQAHKSDLNAVAQISKIEVIMNKVVELDEKYNDGFAHLYLGSLATLLPPSLGGKLELGRKHFEKAIEISGNKNLMSKVIYAKQYARLMFNRKLHDKLLNEVINAKTKIPGYTLYNTLAKQQARELLNSADEYF